MKFNPIRKRQLRLEALESREMLSATPLTAQEYSDLRAQYADFDLPDDEPVVESTEEVAESTDSFDIPEEFPREIGRSR